MANIGKYRKIEFSPEEIEFVKANFYKLTNQELADALKLKKTVVRILAYSLGFKRMEMEFWTQAQITYLKNNFRKKGDTEIAAIFNTKYPKNKTWTKKHIEKKRRYLELKRTPFNIKQIKIRAIEKGVYLAGSKKTKETIGVNPLHTKVIWSINNYKRVMIKLDSGYTSYARYVYLSKYGTIKKGMLLRHLDGNTLNCNINNLVLVDKKTNAMINSKLRLYKNLSAKNYAYIVSYLLNIIKVNDKDYHERFLFSLELGYSGIQEAVSKLGSIGFSSKYKNRIRL